MRKGSIDAKKYSESTGKLHISCPHKDKSGIFIPVVVKGGCCYRSEVCFVFECKFHRLQGDIDKILSVVW